MASTWPTLPHEQWRETCDTLHAHTQVLGKLAVALAPPEPQLQHAALRLSARGWETLPLPAPDGSGAFSAALDLHVHEAVLEHSDGAQRPLRADSTARSARSPASCSAAARELAGEFAIDTTPQEVAWTAPLDERRGHTRIYDPAQVDALLRRGHAGGARARRVPRSVPRPLDARERLVGLVRPRRQPLLRAARRTAVAGLHHAQRDGRAGGGRRLVAGRRALRTGRLLRLRPPARRATSAARSSNPPSARWEGELGEYVLDWEDVCTSPDPHAAALEFAHSAFDHACTVCEWDPKLRGERRRRSAAGRLGPGRRAFDTVAASAAVPRAATAER